jgi:hypothetical protein
MKNKVFLTIGIVLILFAGCGQNKKVESTSSVEKLLQFKTKEKFVKESGIYYSGVDDPIMRSTLSEKINLAADDFMSLAQKQDVSEKDYQDKIEIGLERFAHLYIQLDTEERERICQYFEELMDIVGVESSGGHLNNFMYGFNPNKN